MKKTGVYPCYENQFQINTSKTDTPEMNSIADCETFGVSFDNGIEEWSSFDQEGWVRRLMTAKAVTISVTAKRNVGDAGNDCVAGLAWVSGRNAERDFQLNAVERDMIVKHMFPLNLTPPRYRESILVCIADKICAVYETFSIPIPKNVLQVGQI